MKFEIYLGFSRDTATLTLSGIVDDKTLPVLRALVDQAVRQHPRRLLIRAAGLESISPGGVRCFALAQQRLPTGSDVFFDGAGDRIREALRDGGLEAAVTFIEETPTAEDAAA